MSEEDAQRQAGEAATRIINKQKEKKEIIKKVKQEKEEKAQHKKIRRSRGRAGVPQKIFRLVRAVIGLLILVAYFAPLVKLGGSMQSYYQMGAGGSIWGLVAGAALLISALSMHILAPLLVTLGALLWVFWYPIIEMAAQPLFNQFTAPIIAMLLVAAGLGLHIMNKILGRPF